MTRGVDEHDALALYVRFIGPDVLCDSSRFATRDVGFPDYVQQARLAMVHVAHHGDYRCARHFIARALFFDLLFLNNLLLKCDNLNDTVECFGQVRRCRHVERLIDAGENASIKQCLQ